MPLLYVTAFTRRPCWHSHYSYLIPCLLSFLVGGLVSTNCLEVFIWSSFKACVSPFRVHTGNKCVYYIYIIAYCYIISFFRWSLCTRRPCLTQRFCCAARGGLVAGWKNSQVIQTICSRLHFACRVIVGCRCRRLSLSFVVIRGT